MPWALITKELSNGLYYTKDGSTRIELHDLDLAESTQGLSRARKENEWGTWDMNSIAQYIQRLHLLNEDSQGPVPDLLRKMRSRSSYSASDALKQFEKECLPLAK